MTHFLSRTTAALVALGFAAAAPAQVSPDPAEAERTARNLAKTHLLAQCLVREHRDRVVRALEQIPNSTSERARLAELRRRGIRCAEAVSSFDRETQHAVDFRLDRLDLRAALAEALYEQDFAAGGRVEPSSLAAIPAPGRSAAAAYATAAGDLVSLRRFAFCVVASAPEEAVPLLRIEPGSTTELDAARRMITEFDFCFPANDTASINVPTVRGFLSAAVYRRAAARARGEPVDVPPDRQIARRGSAGVRTVVIVPLHTEENPSAAESAEFSVEEVRTLVDFSRCAARRRSSEAEAALALDYRSDAYERAVRELARRSRTCTPERLRFSRILSAGGLAEELLATSLDWAELRTLAAARAGTPSLEAGGDTEALGVCLVRSDPAGVAALLATVPASEEEYRIVRDLAPRVANCVAGGQVARISQPALRAIAAISAYRLVRQDSGASR